MDPGAKFSTSTSAVFTRRRRIALPPSLLRSSTRPRLLRFIIRKAAASSPTFGGSMRRVSSPSGFFSILITSAPMSASMSVQVGPAMTWVRSMTFNPLRGPMLDSCSVGEVGKGGEAAWAVPATVPLRPCRPLSKAHAFGNSWLNSHGLVNSPALAEAVRTRKEAPMQAQPRQATAEEALDACLDRISEREAEIRAFAHLDAEAARAAARALDARGRPGLLAGMAVGIKDIFATGGMPTGYGSPIYAGHRPAWDAAAVALIRRAGGVVLGKTVTTEFAWMTPGPTRNPRHPGHTPGGSSSGSAAGVAAVFFPAAIGSQTGGSVIRPAAFCGVVGYKPSY